MSQGIMRGYRSLPPTKFHLFNQKVATALADKNRFQDWIWAANPTLLPSYLAASAKHDAVYHESLLGSKLVIAEREVLQAQLIIYLDQIALLLEMAAVRMPEILITSGFDTAKDRRGHSRHKAPPAVPAEQDGDGSGTEA